MRKTFLSIIFLLILLLVPTMVFATEGNVAQIDDVEYATLEEAVTVANSGTETTITLLQDARIKNDLDITGNVKLNLNGFSVAPHSEFSSTHDGITHNALIFVINGGTLTVEDETGKGIIDVEGNEKLYSAIQVTKKGQYDENKTAKLVVNGGTLKGYYYGISGNGSRHNTDITINGGNINCVASDGVAIFHPQVGTLTVNGGIIEGVSGIEMRAGELEVNGGTIIGNGKTLTVTPNGSGNTTYGVGIAIAQHSAGLPVEVIINDGKMQGLYAVYQSDPQKNAQKENGDELINNVSVLIYDGKFETINGGNSPIYSENRACFISGGTFNVDVNKTYLVEDVTAEKDSNGNYVVGTRYNVVIKETPNGTVTSSVERAMEGEKVQLTVNPAMNYELSKLTVLNADNNEVEVVNGVFTMPAGGVTVVAEFTKIIPPIDYIVSGEETENKLGVVETEKTVQTLDTSLKADTELNKKVEEERQNGNQVTIEIVVEELEKDAVNEEEKQKILQTVAANQTVHQYFDISVLVRTNQAQLGKLTQLTEKMKFSMEISKDLIQEGRKFYILKVHGDEVERIEAALNGTKLEFETNQFSTFALAYEDKVEEDLKGEEPKTEAPAEGEKDDTPKTGVINIPVYVWVSIAGIAVVGLVTTKKSSKHSK